MTDDEERDLHTWVWCGHCGAATWGVPPHGEGIPCPLTIEKWAFDRDQRLRADDAYIEKLQAEREYYTDGGEIGRQVKKALKGKFR